MNHLGRSKDEVRALARRCQAIAEFLAARDCIELEKWRLTIDGAAAYGRLTPMRALAEELSHMSKLMLGPADRKELTQRLRDALDVDLDELTAEDERRVKKVVERGSIKTDTEYRMVRALAEELEGDPARTEELDVLNSMLQRYEV